MCLAAGFLIAWSLVIGFTGRPAEKALQLSSQGTRKKSMD